MAAAVGRKVGQIEVAHVSCSRLSKGGPGPQRGLCGRVALRDKAFRRRRSASVWAQVWHCPSNVRGSRRRRLGETGVVWWSRCTSLWLK
jgi:hypothetical protein